MFNMKRSYIIYKAVLNHSQPQPVCRMHMRERYKSRTPAEGGECYTAPI